MVQGGQIWGARTTSQDPAWQDLNVRRLAVYIAQSITQQVQWVVFENNGPALWAALTSSVSGFLQSLWQSGSLHGTKRNDAFFVRCDNATMTQNDIDSGRFVMIVGFAPVRPAEFVILQIKGQTKKK
jgi:phage tail sheath protein FI